MSTTFNNRMKWNIQNFIRFLSKIKNIKDEREINIEIYNIDTSEPYLLYIEFTWALPQKSFNIINEYLNLFNVYVYDFSQNILMLEFTESSFNMKDYMQEVNLL